MAKGRQKRRSKPFWKNLSPEFEHIAAHAGNIVNNSKISDFVEVALYGGVAAVGYNLFQDWRGSIIGMIGLKLATSNNIVAGTAGVATLAGMGLSKVVPWHEVFGPITGLVPEPPTIPEAEKCPPDKTLMIRMGALLCVPNDQIDNYQYRGWEIYEHYLERIGRTEH